MIPSFPAIRHFAWKPDRGCEVLTLPTSLILYDIGPSWISSHEHVAGLRSWLAGDISPEHARGLLEQRPRSEEIALEALTAVTIDPPTLWQRLGMGGGSPVALLELHHSDSRLRLLLRTTADVTRAANLLSANLGERLRVDRTFRWNPAAAAPLQSASRLDEQLDEWRDLFWVDWRAEDSEIVTDCEAILQTSSLRCDVNESDGDAVMTIHFGDRQLRVPLQGDLGDRKRTLLALEKVLDDQFVLRVVRPTTSSDTVAILAVSPARWQEILHGQGELAPEHFGPLAEYPSPIPG
ncbi:MAG: hypothetical protein RL885_15815 [Planctomycetota bacterium]